MRDVRDRIALGKIIGVHGVQGWVKIHSNCRPREAIFNYEEFYLTRNHKPLEQTLTLKQGRVQGKGLAVKFSEITNRDQAMAIIGTVIEISRQTLPELEDGFYWADLIGLTVINREGEHLGVVKDIFETGANDVIIVKQNNKEIMIPFVVGMYIDEADFDQNVLKVDWQQSWSEITAEDVEDNAN